jgi:K+-sensing histidine kinase KdpD
MGEKNMNNDNNVMVCITQQKTCERLITKGYELKKCIHGKNLFVYHVVTENAKFLNSDKESDALEHLFSITKKFNGNMVVTKHDNVVKSIVDFVKNNNISDIIIGESPISNQDEDTIIDKLTRALPNLNINMIAKEED